MRLRSHARWPVLPGLVYVLSTVAAMPVHAAEPRLEGMVRDSLSRAGLADATIVVVGTTIAATTDGAGRFVLTGGLEQSVVLEISRPGYQPRRVEVPSLLETPTLDLALEPILPFADEITVSPRAQEHGAVAPSSTATMSDPIHGPASSAAEAIERLHGVVVSRDRGEADGILVRGAEARLVATTLDGERLSSTVGGSRSAGLGMVPLELVETARLSKTFSPDRAADAIGGVVDLVTRQPPDGRRRSVTLGGGLAEPGGSEKLGAFSLGGRSRGGRLGGLLSLTMNDADSEPDRVETHYGDRGIEKLDLRDFSLERRRSGILATVDLTPTDRSELRLRGFWNPLSIAEVRRRVRSDFADLEVERELKDSQLERQLLSLRASGSHLIRGRYLLDASAVYSAAKEREPYRVDSAFVAGIPKLSPENANTPEVMNADRFRLNEIGVEDNALADRTAAVSANLAFPLQHFNHPTRLRFGTKLRHKSRFQDQNTFLFEPLQDVFLSELLDPNFFGEGFARGQFLIGPMLDPRLNGELIERFGWVGRRSFEEDAADYEASETEMAAYGLIETDWGKRLRVMAGLRWEHSETDYAGNEVLAGENEAESRLRPLRGDKTDDFLMPSASLAFELREGLILRAALSRTFARPDYFDLIPFELIDLEDDEIERGNPELDVTSSWNFDAALEWTFSTGRLAVASFYKSLTDFTFRSRSEMRFGDDLFAVSQPRSGEAADLYGLELTFEQRLEHLAPGLEMEVNLTLTESAARFSSRPEAGLRLPGQASYSGNLLLAYHRGRFSAALAANFVDDYLFQLGDSPGQDLYVGEQLRWNLSADFAVSQRWRLFLQAENLADEVAVLYQGSPDRPYRQDFGSRSFVVGLRFDF